MPSLLPELHCALCREAIDPSQSFFRASGAFLPERDALFAYSNAPMHWECYDAWSERPRFAQQYIAAWVKANRKNPFWWSVHLDEHVYISVNPLRSVEEASVRLTALGSDIRVPLPKWSAWLADPLSVTPKLTPVEHRRLAPVLPALLVRFPHDHALVDAINPDEKTSPRPRERGSRAD